MTVFKGYLLIAWRKRMVALIYFVVFLGITFIYSYGASSREESLAYQASSTSIAVIDRDHTPTSKALKAYLGTKHQVVEIEDQASILEEELYYETINHVVIIESGFEEHCIEGTESVDIINGTAVVTATYIEMSINSYLNLLDQLVVGGYTVSEASEKASLYSEQEPRVSLITDGKQNIVAAGYDYFFNFVPYMFLCMLTYLFGSIMLETKPRPIQMRNQCSGMSSRRQHIQSISAFVVLGVIVFGLTILVSIIVYGKQLMKEPLVGYYYLNAFMLLITILALAYLIGQVTPSDEALSGITNVVALGMSFLGGVFIPLSYMSASVLRVAKFLPTYWYERNINYLIQYRVLDGNLMVKFNQGLLVQLAMATVAIVLAMVIGKRRR